jgi:two-component system, sensor histidine kinase
MTGSTETPSASPERNPSDRTRELDAGRPRLGLIPFTLILDLSKIEASRLDLECVEFDLRDLFSQTVHTIELACRRKNLTLIASVSPSVPRKVFGNPLRLRQILLNLLDNAVKFTSFGEIRFLVDSPDPDNVSVIRFQVADTGIGIPAELHRHIFSMFSQADTSTTRKYGGTGLGLAISSRLAELMQGRIEVDSAPGKGSTFTFTARFSPAPAQQEGTPFMEDSVDAAGCETGESSMQKEITSEELPSLRPETAAVQDTLTRRLLLVDDSENNRMLILWYVKDMPYVVDIAMNGEEAVELFRTRRYDAVLMDIQMPVMDGIAATRLIRETEREQGLPPTPIISLSANTLQEDEQMCIEAGSTRFLAKPVKRSDLLLAVERSIHLALRGKSGTSDGLTSETGKSNPSPQA